MFPGVNVYTAPVTGTMVITPSNAPGQLVLVVDAPVEVAAPAPTLMLLEPEQPFASVNVAVCSPAVTPVNVPLDCGVPPSKRKT